LGSILTLPPELDAYISAAMFIIGAYLFALWIGMVVWTFRDIRLRTRDVLAQVLATLMVAVLTLPGLLVYVLLRPHNTLADEYERSLTEEAILQGLEENRICPSCQRRIEPDYVVCPSCHHQLKARCVGCGRLLNLDWDVCPYCGRYRDQSAPEAYDHDHDHEVETPEMGAAPAGPAMEEGAPE
jgi:RNA polymerase subunit RPABC4/transcription elongation factor Spt4